MFGKRFSGSATLVLGLTLAGQAQAGGLLGHKQAQYLAVPAGSVQFQQQAVQAVPLQLGFVQQAVPTVQMAVPTVQYSVPTVQIQQLAAPTFQVVTLQQQAATAPAAAVPAGEVPEFKVTVVSSPPVAAGVPSAQAQAGVPSAQSQAGFGVERQAGVGVVAAGSGAQVQEVQGGSGAYLIYKLKKHHCSIFCHH